MTANYLLYTGLSLWAIILPVNAAPGDLDTSFGNGGIVTTFVGSIHAYARSMVLQSDGKIVLAGYTDDGSIRDFAVVRYNPEGILDTTFNGTGKVSTDFRGSDDFALGVALQSDGKIVVAGYSYRSGNGALMTSPWPVTVTTARWTPPLDPFTLAR